VFLASLLLERERLYDCISDVSWHILYRTVAYALATEGKQHIISCREYGVLIDSLLAWEKSKPFKLMHHITSAKRSTKNPLLDRDIE